MDSVTLASLHRLTIPAIHCATHDPRGTGEARTAGCGRHAGSAQTGQDPKTSCVPKKWYVRLPSLGEHSKAGPTTVQLHESLPLFGKILIARLRPEVLKCQEVERDGQGHDIKLF